MASRRTKYRRKHCVQKVTYRTYREAQLYCDNLNTTTLFVSVGLMPYRCKISDHWHIGHTPDFRTKILLDEQVLSEYTRIASSRRFRSKTVKRLRERRV